MHHTLGVYDNTGLSTVVKNEIHNKQFTLYRQSFRQANLLQSHYMSSNFIVAFMWPNYHEISLGSILHSTYFVYESLLRTDNEVSGGINLRFLTGRIPVTFYVPLASLFIVAMGNNRLVSTPWLRLLQGFQCFKTPPCIWMLRKRSSHMKLQYPNLDICISSIKKSTVIFVSNHQYHKDV